MPPRVAVIGGGPAGRVEAGDLVITADIPLAAQVIEP